MQAHQQGQHCDTRGHAESQWIGGPPIQHRPPRGVNASRHGIEDVEVIEGRRQVGPHHGQSIKNGREPEHDRDAGLHQIEHIPVEHIQRGQQRRRQQKDQFHQKMRGNHAQVACGRHPEQRDEEEKDAHLHDQMDDL